MAVTKDIQDAINAAINNAIDTSITDKIHKESCTTVHVRVKDLIEIEISLSPNFVIECTIFINGVPIIFNVTPNKRYNITSYLNYIDQVFVSILDRNPSNLSGTVCVNLYKNTEANPIYKNCYPLPTQEPIGDCININRHNI
jgi:hypothetical protein